MDPFMRLPMSLKELHFRVYPVMSGWYESGQGVESLNYLGKLVEEAARAAPEARITCSSTNRDPMSPVCHAAAESILERVQRQRNYRKRISSHSRSRLDISQDSTS